MKIDIGIMNLESSSVSRCGAKGTFLSFAAYLAMCTVLMVSAQPASAQIAFDNASFGGETNTFDHIIGGGDSRMLIVGVGREAGGDVTVTYGGAAMTRIAGAEVRVTTGAIQWTDLFWLDEAGLPGVGSFQVAISGANDPALTASGAISLENVAQGPPEATAANGDFDSEALTDMSVAITTITDGAWVVDVLGSGFGGVDGTQTRVPTVQTARGTVEGGSNGTVMSTLEVPTAGATTVGYTIEAGGNRTALSVAAFESVPARPTVTIARVGDLDSPFVDTTGSWTVDFSEDVTGVTDDDFTLETTGDAAASGGPTVSGGPASYTVDITGVSGTGSIGLNFLVNDVVATATGLAPVGQNNAAAFTNVVPAPAAKGWVLVFLGVVLTLAAVAMLRKKALKHKR